MPWLGFFDKMRLSDVFVLLDTVPYTKNGYQNRCMIRGAHGEFWLTAPVLTKGHFGQLTMDVEINNRVNWRDKHWKSLQQHYGKAPFFAQYAPFFEHVFQQEWPRLVDINYAIISYIVGSLGISTQLLIASQLGVAGAATELILDICKKVDADTYLSGPSGRRYLDDENLYRENVALTYHDFKHPMYTQLHSPFVPRLSVVDLMFNHGDRSLSILERAATGGPHPPDQQ